MLKLADFYSLASHSSETGFNVEYNSVVGWTGLNCQVIRSFCGEKSVCQTVLLYLSCLH